MPDPIIEGGKMSLTCKTRLTPQKAASPGKLQFSFYRDGRMAQNFSQFSTYQVFPVQMKDSGNYSCEAKISSNSETKMSKTLTIHIQELFSMPEIRVSPHPVTPGANLSVTCSTVSKSDTTKLQFRFYKDRVLVRNESFFNNYYINSVQLKDSGNYSCDVHINGTVRKSKEVGIQLQAFFASNDNFTDSTNTKDKQQTHEHLIVTLVLLGLLLIVAALLIKYKNKLLTVFPATCAYGSHPGPATELPVGTDPYYSIIEFSPIERDPVFQTTNTNVTYSQVNTSPDTLSSTKQVP
uniref:Ig-like domain-containing protein n=1 Tax=Xenopus tropicalis TaxID=8364 RepID=A0A803K905_XENTR